MRAHSLALGLLLLAAGSPAVAGEKRPQAGFALPPVLTRFGFGNPKEPVTVTLEAPIGRKTARPVDAKTGGALPHNTQWVFTDPAPVWKALEAATTRRFLENQMPGAAARLTIAVKARHGRRVIHFHYRQGRGDVAIRQNAPHGRVEGGAWEFDPAADRALVALLSRTKPTYVGAPALAVKVVYAKPQGNAARILHIDDAQTLNELKPRLTWRYPRTSSWKLPQDFSWKTHFLVFVQLPQAPMHPKRLNYGNARTRGGVLRWRLWTQPEDKRERAQGKAAAVLGVFERPRYLTHVRADIDDWAQVEQRVPMSDDYRTPQPDAVFLRVRERYHNGKRWVTPTHTDIWFDGRYARHAPLRHSPGPPAPIVKSEYGRLPQALCMRLRKAFKANPAVAAAAGRSAALREYVLHLDDTKTKKPDGIEDLVAYIHRVHGGP